MKSNPHEERLFARLQEVTGVIPTREHRFHPVRRWRFDFAFVQQKVAVELEGGTWMGGKHVHPIGYEKDCEKYNMATKMGWKVFRVVPKQVSIDYLTFLLIDSSALE